MTADTIKIDVSITAKEGITLSEVVNGFIKILTERMEERSDGDGPITVPFTDSRETDLFSVVTTIRKPSENKTENQREYTNFSNDFFM